MPVALAAASALIIGGAVGAAIGVLSRGSTAGTAPSTATLPPSAAGAAAAQARAVYRQALAAANASTGFHYVAVTTGAGAGQKFVGDAGQAGGSQVITMDSTYGQEQFTLVLVSASVYFQGNVPALRDQLGVPATNAAGLVGKWISVASGDGPYPIIAPGITVADQVQETGLVPTSMQTIAGGAVRILGSVPSQQGGPAGTGHLELAAGSRLPIAYVASFSGNGATTTSTTTFSKWGTAPAVAAPSGAVAWSTLGASSPPGGYGSGGVSTSPTPQA
ncbi:MAG TPA: hypothetical protein VLO10_05855 [Candidatus Deferrimicrobium sp.]|nr:hypothetical protein [Candidatus Deferrimicrobium sp.]